MTTESVIKSDYLDYVESLAARAEVETNGVLWNTRGSIKRELGALTQWDLFRRPWAHVAPYMSEELREFFDHNGRMTYTQYRTDIRAYLAEAKAAYLDSL